MHGVFHDEQRRVDLRTERVTSGEEGFEEPVECAGQAGKEGGGGSTVSKRANVSRSKNVSRTTHVMLHITLV